MGKAEASRILVDDDRLLRRIMAEGLAAEGASCSEDEELSSRAKSLGALGVLRKPCTPSDVMRLISRYAARFDRGTSGIGEP